MCDSLTAGVPLLIDQRPLSFTAPYFRSRRSTQAQHSVWSSRKNRQRKVFLTIWFTSKMPKIIPTATLNTHRPTYIHLSIYICSTMWLGCQSRRFNCLFWRETRQRILGHEISPYPEVVRGREWELATGPSREGSWWLDSREANSREELAAGQQRGEAARKKNALRTRNKARQRKENERNKEKKRWKRKKPTKVGIHIPPSPTALEYKNTKKKKKIF